MEPEEIERILISSLKTPEHLNILRQKYKISPRHFPYFPEPATYIWDFIVQWGKAPDLTYTLYRKMGQKSSPKLLTECQGPKASYNGEIAEGGSRPVERHGQCGGRGEGC